MSRGICSLVFSRGGCWGAGLMGLVLVSPVAGQEPQHLGGIGIEVGEIDLRDLPLLRLDVRLEIAGGDPVHGVGPEDVRVEFDGEASGPVRWKPIGFDGTETAVVLAVDLSTSMRPVMDEVKEGLMGLVARVPGESEVGLVTFATSPSRVAELAVGGARLNSRIQEMEARGYTAMRDAVGVGLAMLEVTDRQNRHLILITDGVDNRSSITPQDLLRSVQESSVHLHVLAIGEELDGPLLRELSHVSRGSYLDVIGRPLTSTDLRRLASALAPSGSEPQYVLEVEVDPSVMDRWANLHLMVQPPGFSMSSFERPVFLSPRRAWGEGGGIGTNAGSRRSQERPMWATVVVGVSFLLLLGGSVLTVSERRQRT